MITSFRSRLPFAQIHDGDFGPAPVDAGDLTIITKYALINDREAHDPLSAGLTVTLPFDAAAQQAQAPVQGVSTSGKRSSKAFIKPIEQQGKIDEAERAHERREARDSKVIDSLRQQGYLIK